MATQNTVQVNVNVSDNGTTAQRLKDAKALHSELRAVQQTASGGKGYKSAMQPKGAISGTEYGQARGIEGRTGASARDFANQAQGLGGLVRLYATYAANLFAVSAAYKALSEAANTDNMVKGLNQLGAASGVAMGSLSKQFAEASGGAISLRESMEATAKAVSSGMSSKQFLELGEVAKKASQALGVNMSDAVSRLTRGITKLEPELLDELGIFTRVDQAVKDYAKSVGRTEASLNSFERRQAFANAVLAEGKQKFNEINIDTNPYDMLLAKLKDTAQGILSVVNTAITPIVKLFADNTGLITAAIALLGVKLVNSVMPALGEYRKSLAASAAVSKEFYTSRAELAQKAIDAENDAIKSRFAERADMASNKVDAAETRLKELSTGRIDAKTKSILDSTRAINTISKEELAYLDKKAAATSKRTGELTKQALVYKEIAASIREAQREEAAFFKVQQEMEAARAKGPGKFTSAGKAIRDAESARRVSASKQVLSDTSEVAATQSLGAAWKTLNEGIAKSNLGAVRAGVTRLGGAMVIAGRGAAILAAGLQSVFMYIGLAVTAFQILDSVFSNNSKEMSNLNDKLDTVSSNLEAGELTAKKYENTLSPESLMAKATGLKTIADSLEDVATAAELAAEKSNIWDRSIEGIKDLFGFGATDKLGEEAKKTVATVSKLIQDPKAKEAFNLKIKALIGNKDIEDYFDDLPLSEAAKRFKEVKSAAQEAADASAKTAGDFGDAVASSKALSDSIKEVEKGYKAAKDPVTQLGVSIVESSTKFATAVKDPINSVAALNKLLEDQNTIKAFGSESVASITASRDKLVQYNAELANVNKQLNEAKILAQQGTNTKINKTLEIGLSFKKSELEALISTTMRGLEREFNANIAKGLKLIEQPLTNAIATANNKVASTLVGLLPNNEASIRAKAEVEREAVRIQIANTNAIASLNQTMMESNLLAEKSLAIKEADEKLKALGNNADARDIRAITSSRDSKTAKIDADIAAIKSGKFTTAQKTDSATAQAYQASIAVSAQLQALIGQLKSSKIAEAVNVAQAKETAASKGRATAISDTKASRELYYKSNEFADLAPNMQEQLKEQDTYILRIAELGAKIQDINGQLTVQEALQKEIRASGISPAIMDRAIQSSQTQVLELQKQLTVATEIYNIETLGGRAALERANDYRNLSLELERQTGELEAQQRLEASKQASLAVSGELAQLEMDRLGFMREQGLLNEDEYNQKSKVFQIEKEARESNSRIISLTNDKLKIQLDYAIKIANALKSGNQPEAMRLAQESQDQQNAADSAIANEQKVSNARIQNIELLSSMTERQKAYGQVFEGTIDSMADAMVEFAKTGKLSFGDMIESMLSDLLRYEMRMQMMNLYKGMGGAGGILGAIGGLFGGGGSAASIAASDISFEADWLSATQGLFAKGGAWESGVQKFAKGGTFTNSVVSSPTLFKFAKGTGLMGEAGPEAIMPLKRGSDGSLGVQAQQAAPKVDVVVINNGSEKAETRESMDSRGNRKIEVVIGEMVAAEMGRANSPVQSSMKNNFGVTPMLTRR